MKIFYSFAACAAWLMLAASFMVASVSPSRADHIYEGDAFSGGWWMSGRVQGDITLGDGNGYGLALGSTENYCVLRGAGYSTIRSFIDSNYPDWVYWYVDQICSDGYVRVCVSSAWGEFACSTFADRGWVPLN